MCYRVIHIYGNVQGAMSGGSVRGQYPGVLSYHPLARYGRLTTFGSISKIG